MRASGRQWSAALVKFVQFVFKKRRGTPIDDASPVVRQYARDKALQVTTCGTSAAVGLSGSESS